jgi:hypothetical protein
LRYILKTVRHHPLGVFSFVAVSVEVKHWANKFLNQITLAKDQVSTGTSLAAAATGSIKVI